MKNTITITTVKILFWNEQLIENITSLEAYAEEAYHNINQHYPDTFELADFIDNSSIISLHFDFNNDDFLATAEIAYT